MAVTRLSPSRRREDVRAWWAAHLEAQRRSGQNQVAYCRAQGIDPKYFTLWKGKLHKRRGAETPRLVPVQVRPDPNPALAWSTDTTRASVLLHLTLDNGISADLELPLHALPHMVRQLASL